MARRVESQPGSVSTAGINSSSAPSRAKSCSKRKFSDAGTGRREPPLPACEQQKACTASRTSLYTTHRPFFSLQTQGWNELAPGCTKTLNCKKLRHQSGHQLLVPTDKG